MSPLRVLVVGVAEPLCGAVADAGHRTTAVGDRDAALARLRSGACDCVLAAAALPDGTGFDLAAEAAEHVDLLPTVVAGTEPPAAVADAAIGTEVAAYLQQPSAGAVPDGLADAVTEAAATFRRRRDRSLVGRESAAAGCVVRDGTVAYCTPGIESLLIASDDVRGSSLVDLVAEEDREALRTALGTVDEGPGAVRFSPARDRHRTLEAELRPASRDDAVVVVLRDVTDAVRRESELETDRQMLETLLGNVPLSMYFKDRQSRHQRVSRYITKTDPEEYIKNDEGKVHPHPADIVGKSDFDLYAPEFAEEAVADDRRVMEEGEPIVSRIEAGTTNLGEDLYTSTTKAPRYDDEGDVVGLVGVTVDVTDRITHRQELERQNERLDEFAEVLTHDLRNPLQIAQGYLETVRSDYEGEAVEDCATALSRMEALIEEIRSFVLEGRTVADPEPVDLERAAGEAWSTVDTGDAALDVDGELYLRADPDRLLRLLENLFRNSIDHATDEPDSDGSDLSIRVEALDDGFAVEDDGVGLPPDAGTEVFERGFTTTAGGTGFGLAIVRNIAEAHGWDVGAPESEDAGARFTFTGVVRVEESVGQTLTDLS